MRCLTGGAVIYASYVIYAQSVTYGEYQGLSGRAGQ
jgi:hypothetical protein